MQNIIKELNSPTRLLVASIRSVSDLVNLAEGGLNTFTLLPSLIDELLTNDLTELAADSFESVVKS